MASPARTDQYSILYQALEQQFHESPLPGRSLRNRNSTTVVGEVANTTLEQQKIEGTEVVQQIELSSHTRGVWRLLPINANTVLSCSYDGTAKIWNLNDLELQQPNNPILLKGTGFKNKRHEILSAILLTNEIVITGSANGVMNFWNPNNGQKKGFIREPKDKTTGFYSLALLGEGTVASGACQMPSKEKGYWSHDIKIWDIENLSDLQLQSPSATLKGHQGGISAIVNLGNKKLASSSGDRTIRLWDADRTEAISILKGHTDYVYTVANLGNNILGSGSKDFTARLWNIEKGQECGQLMMPQALEAHSSTVYDVAPFQEHLVLTASRDAFIKMWDLRSNQLVKVFDTGDSFAYSVAGVGDDTIVAGTCANSENKGREGGNVVIWKLKK